MPLVFWLLLQTAPSGDDAVTIVKDGTAQMPVVVGSISEPVEELTRCLERISSARFDTVKVSPERNGLCVGLVSDFPWIKVDRAEELGEEGFLLKTDGKRVLLLAHRPLGVRHAVSTFLHRLGCRWFFPGETWEAIPERATITVRLDERETPDFPTQRRIWYGYGAYPDSREAYEAWNRRNRMGGPNEISIGHTWHGLDPKTDFTAHPEWFALVKGKRQPSKPCYSHPGVAERALKTALQQAGQGRRMISMTPPDGLGYCECERCLAVFKGAKPYREHNSLFARLSDGMVVNVTSETLFSFINKVAEGVAKKHPNTQIGCYAYSAYSHPPSFTLHPNVYLQTTAAFRRTPLAFEEQITAFGKKLKQVGIREYYSVFQWDWDEPVPGKIEPRKLQETLRFYRDKGVTAVNAEASNNWGPRGLGYYVASRLLWNADEDITAILRDFYEKAFGPAAKPMQRYYARWYGPGVIAIGNADEAPPQAVFREKGRILVESLREAFRDLDEAARLTKEPSKFRRRVDDLRRYLHYLVLKLRLQEAERTKDQKRILEAVRDETVFCGRLTLSGMVHSRPLLGKAFLRRFRKHAKLLEKTPEAQKANQGWRCVGEPPSSKEFEALWSRDKEILGIK